MESKEITFFVHECMEFPSLGVEEDNIPTIEKAVELYNALPDTTKNMIHGIGITIDGWDYGIYYNGNVDYDSLRYLGSEALETVAVKHAISYLEETKKLTESKTEPVPGVVRRKGR